MQITEVRIKLVEHTAERLLAFCSITIDSAFVVRDLKIIGGPSGPFVAMPSRKLSTHCHACGFKNPLRAGYCNQCGKKQAEQPPPRDDDGRLRLYADIAHPINAACRDFIQRRIVTEYEAEIVRARQPGYVSRYECIGDEERQRR
jgi:stage V sporulation protein G